MQTHSYRARITRAEHDPQHPDAHASTVGIKATTPLAAAHALAVILPAGTRIVDVYRQDLGAA